MPWLRHLLEKVQIHAPVLHMLRGCPCGPDRAGAPKRGGANEAERTAPDGETVWCGEERRQLGSNTLGLAEELYRAFGCGFVPFFDPEMGRPSRVGQAERRACRPDLPGCT